VFSRPAAPRGAPLIAFFAMSGFPRPCPTWDFHDFLSGGWDWRETHPGRTRPGAPLVAHFAM